MHTPSNTISIKDLETQEAAVELARNAMINHMKEYAFTKFSSDMEPSEDNVLSLTANVKMLEDLHGEEFFRVAIERGVADSYMLSLYNDDFRKLMESSNAGRGANPSQTRDSKADVEARRLYLETAARSCKAHLSLKLSELSWRLEGDKMYAIAKRQYETELQQLNALRERRPKGNDHRPQ